MGQGQRSDVMEYRTLSLILRPLKASENQNPQSSIHAIVRNNALGNAAMHEEADKVSGSSDNADKQGTSQLTIANNQPFLCQ